MMSIASQILTAAIYGRSGFITGSFVALRALTGPATSIRNRLFALAAFGFGVAVFAWTRMTFLVLGEPEPTKTMLGIVLIATLPLYYFAFGRGRWRFTHAVVLATIFTWYAAIVLIKEVMYLDALTRVGVAMPAMLCAAFMVFRDPAFRINKQKLDPPLLIAGGALAFFAMTQIISVLGNFLHISIFGIENLDSIFPVHMNSIRAALMLILTAAILLLLGRFEAVMRREAEQDTKQNRINLAVSENQLASILKIAPEAIIITDANLRINLFNKGAERTFGHTEREILGQHIENLMPAWFRIAYKHHVEALADTSKQDGEIGQRLEAFGLRKNGQEFPALASISRVETPNGPVYTTILNDISTEKAARNELLNAKLAAEAANEAKSLFIANMSHELRTPLNAIIGFSSLLTEKSGLNFTKQKRIEYAKDIEVAGEHLLKIINDILDISRIEVGKIKLNEEVVAINDLVESCLRMERIRAKEIGIEIKNEIPFSLPEVLIDRRLLTQVLLNIVSNALKFTERNGSVFIAAHQNSFGGVDFSVRDTGIGMRPEVIRQVGEPFMQADASHTRKYQGAGLGLAISKRIVELLGGKLVIESVLGQGTKVMISLPSSRVLSKRLVEAAG